MVIFILVLGVGATTAALDCRFTRETTLPAAGPERTTFLLDCPLSLPAEVMWRALQDFPHLTEGTARPREVEFARYLDSEVAKREVAARLESIPLSPKPDASELLNLPLEGPLLYEEFYHVNLFFLWAVRRFEADASRAAEGIYRLSFRKVDGLSSEAIFEGGFELVRDGDRSRLRYTLILSTHQKLQGEGLLDLLQRLVVGGIYLDGYQTYMMERVEGIVREAERLAGTDGSRGK